MAGLSVANYFVIQSSPVHSFTHPALQHTCLSIFSPIHPPTPPPTHPSIHPLIHSPLSHLLMLLGMYPPSHPPILLLNHSFQIIRPSIHHLSLHPSVFFNPSINRFTYPSTHLSFHPLNHSLLQSILLPPYTPTHPFIHPCIHSYPPTNLPISLNLSSVYPQSSHTRIHHIFIYLPSIEPLIQSCILAPSIQPPSHPPIQPFSPLIHPFTYSPTNPLCTHACIQHPPT